MVGDGGRGRGSVFAKFLKSNSKVVCSEDRRGEKFEKECVCHFLSFNGSPKEKFKPKRIYTIVTFFCFLVKRSS